MTAPRPPRTTRRPADMGEAATEDAELLALLGRFDALEHAAQRADQTATNGTMVVQEACLSEQVNLVGSICKMPARTLAGVRARARTFLLWTPREERPTPAVAANSRGLPDHRMLAALLRDLLALHGEGAGLFGGRRKAAVMTTRKESHMTVKNRRPPHKAHLEPLPNALAYTIADACRISGFGKTKLRELIADSRLQVTRVTGRPLVIGDSLRALLTVGAKRGGAR